MTRVLINTELGMGTLSPKCEGRCKEPPAHSGTQSAPGIPTGWAPESTLGGGRHIPHVCSFLIPGQRSAQSSKRIWTPRVALPPIS